MPSSGSKSTPPSHIVGGRLTPSRVETPPNPRFHHKGKGSARAVPSPQRGTAAKEITEARQGKEGETGPVDAADVLLTHGLRALLRKTMLLNGPNKFFALGPSTLRGGQGGCKCAPCGSSGGLFFCTVVFLQSFGSFF